MVTQFLTLGAVSSVRTDWLASSRGIFRAPRIEVAEQLSGPVRSPVHFKLTFRAFGGSSIDPGSVSVTYLKSSDVDLTPRVRPFLTGGGIDIPEAEVPPGNHVIRVSVHDSDGREGTTQFSLTVNPADRQAAGNPGACCLRGLAD